MKSLTKRLCGDIDMTLSMARQIVLAARPQGKPQLTDFRLEETAIPTPASGQLLLRVQYLSLDPYMRGRVMVSGDGHVFLMSERRVPF
jgi:NADPH-dependent curcumin reductase CurA